MTRLISTSLMMLALLVALERRALADDALVVLPTGGATQGYVFDLDVSSDGSDTGPDDGIGVVDLGRRALVAGDVGPVAIRDLKILPDGANLMADVGGRGVAITAQDASFRYTFAPPGDRPRVTSASVSAFAAPGEPSRLLVTDSNRSLAMVIEPGENEMLWQRSFAQPGARATFSNAIALPENRAAFGVSWASLGLSAIDLYEMSSGEPTDLIRRLASGSDPEFPAATVVVPEIGELRDVMGLPGGNLLVTTRYGLSEITVEGDVVWSIDIGQTTELRGEFSSATLLASGRIAVATYEPGVWTNPHTNHRVHWLAPAALEQNEVDVVATSPSLSFAPARVEPAEGDGGSGTFGYRPGLDTTGTGDLADLELARELTLDADTYRRGERIWGSARLRNAGTETVSISRATIVISPGACGATSGIVRTLADLAALDVGAGEGVELQGQHNLAQDALLGRWCATVRVQNGSGASMDLGAPVTFDVVEGGVDTGSTVVVRDLGHWTADAADVGFEDADAPAGDEGPEPGCACWTGASSSTGRAVDLGWILCALVAIGAVARRRRRRPDIQAG